MRGDGDPDREWVERAQAGDETAMAELLRRYREPLHAFVFRLLGNRTDAEDAAQEAFARAFRHIERFRFRPSARFSTWLFQLARNAALDELRRARRRPATQSTPPTDPATTAPDAASALAHRELGDAIAAAVAVLPEDQRSALILAEYHGHSASEVANVLQCSVRGAESRLFRARQAVRATLVRQGWL